MSDALIVGRCPACREVIAADHPYAWCEKCGTALPGDLKARLDNPYTRQPPVLGGAVESAADPRVAAPWMRVLARAVDALFGIFVAIPAIVTAMVVLTAANVPGSVEQWFPQDQAWSLPSLGFGLVGTMIYFIAAEWLGSASVGKLVCGLRVTTTKFGPISLKASCIRGLGFLFDALFFGLIGILKMNSSARRQRFGDEWADTLVVRRRALPGELRPAGFIVLGLLIGSGAWWALETISLLVRAFGAAR